MNSTNKSSGSSVDQTKSKQLKTEKSFKSKKPESNTAADPSDPLDVALLARKKNNYEPISENEARKLKLVIPKPLKHKITGAD